MLDRGRTRTRELLADGIETDLFTCAAAAVGRAGTDPTVVSVGERDPERGRPLTRETRFDLASLTKPIVTTTLTFQLVEMGDVVLTDALDEYVEPLPALEEGAISLHALLTHTSGLQAYSHSPEWTSREDVLKGFANRSIQHREPGTAFEYSCLNFFYLAQVCESVTGRAFSDLARDRIFDPLGMEGAAIGPVSSDEAPVAVTYDHAREDRPLAGEIHDPIARSAGGHSGNAGLFATVDGVARFADEVLAAGTGRRSGSAVLSPASIEAMRAVRARSEEVNQGYGWRLGTDHTPATTWSKGAIGHTGYTGTSLWIDFDRDAYAALLTNAVYEAAPPELERYRRRFHGIVAADAAR